ncbi:hypothetical protein [Candidatus Manganitrophus noduliformans]|uniref:Uncharacterized protein n=1 Tax=Candidatus Manganitrophus noduliformans TaxID=2606439 RepID=A0A7X6ICE9_9BACT|nr:hypothetical protein [Candidatus Manganitrophus noduliformans]NKE72578.1 hypothetical protein [Candidatus Manganitrophus noduliformans]
MIDQYFGLWIVLIAFLFINVIFAMTSSMDIQSDVPDNNQTPEGIEPNWSGTTQRPVVGKIKYLKPHAGEPIIHSAR